MSGAVNSWRQIGKVFAWRYLPHQKKHRGWHFTCDDAACESLSALIAAVQGEAGPSRRSVALSPVTPAVWGVPNFREPVDEGWAALVLSYAAQENDIRISSQDERVHLQFGSASALLLIKALRDIRSGSGDYTLRTRDGDAPLWIWWMSRQP